MINAELVWQGYAQVATYPPNVKYQELSQKLQQKSREAKRGLWGRMASWGGMTCVWRGRQPRDRTALILVG
jgi:micrococcal nuclease